MTVEKKIAKKDGGGMKSEEKPAKYVKNTDVIQARVKAAYEGMGVVPALTPSEEIKTDRDALENSGDHLLTELADAGPVSTVLKTFMPTLKQGVEVPINTSFNTILETGRISAFKPNLLNIMRSIWSSDQRADLSKQYHSSLDPEHKEYLRKLLTYGVRECFKPRLGFCYISSDYSCAELRSVAQVCLWLFGKSSMAEFFQADPNGDPHLSFGASIMGITEEEAKTRKKDPKVKEARQFAKVGNFGLPGGLGPEKLAESARKSYGVLMSRERAVQLKQEWFQRWPEMRDYLAHGNRTAGMGGVTTMQFRPGGLPHRKRGNLGYCDFLNGTFQALTADGFGEAVSRVSKECYVDCGTPLFGCRLIVGLYDELIIEAPIATAHEAAQRLAKLMIEAMELWTPDVPAVTEPALMLRWQKGAEAVYDESGRLQIWEMKL